MKMKTFLMGSVLMLAFMAMPSIALAQDATTPQSSSDYLIAGLAAVAGFLTMAWNTGTIFGKKTLPKPWLPYVGAAATFLGAMDLALPKGVSITKGILFMAAVAGIKALAGNAGGAAFHSMLTAHRTSRGAAATVAAGGAPPPGSAASIRPPAMPAASPTANDTVPPSSPKASAYRPLPEVGPVAFFSIAFKRMMWRLTAATTLVGLVAIGASMGANCDATPTPQTAAEIAASIKLGACIESTYVTDAQKTPPPTPVQIALDIATVCGAEVPDVVTAFSTSSSAVASPSSAVASSSSAVPSRAQVTEAAKGNAPAMHTAVLAFRQNLAAAAVKAAPTASSSAGH
jgi:hypothetical protein